MIDISALRERNSKDAYTVTELNNFIKNLLESDRTLSAVSVSGEISNLTCHRSGHLYFSLKDGEGQLRSVMFRSSANGLKFMPENGMRVIARGSVSVYTRDGSYQLYVSSMQLDGIGSLYLAYERLKERLALEGLFSEERKKAIPRYPSAIGVITSPTGAAVRDIINVISRRYPLATVYLYPSLVQGDGAESNLIEGLEYFDKSGLVDTVIIGRGGGSIEDLWAFNGELLARKIYECRIPVISAVGHETDFTICDFVSDLRAPTPSAAAELATPDLRELNLRVDYLRDRLDASLLRAVQNGRQSLIRLTERAELRNPRGLIEDRRQQLRDINERTLKAFSLVTERHRGRLGLLLGRLNALNPLSVLERGYSIVRKNGENVRLTQSLSKGDDLEIKLCDGTVKATVTDVCN